MFEQAFRNIEDLLRNKAGCTTELDCTEQSSWLLFKKYLANLEEDKATAARLEGKKYSFNRNLITLIKFVLRLLRMSLPFRRNRAE